MQMIGTTQSISIDGVTIRYIRNSERIDHILFLGLGQSGDNLRAVAKNLPDTFLVVGAIPFWKKRRYGYHQVSEFAARATQQIINTTGTHSVVILAESQAAPAVVAALSRDTKRIAQLALISPLGLNTESLGKSSEERYRSLMKRSKQFWNHPNQTLFIRGNRQTIKEITKSILTLPKNIKQDYTFGANQDIADTVIGLAHSLPVTVYAAQNDSLFPYDEIATRLQSTEVKVINLGKTTHLNRATPRGIEQLQTIISQL